MISKTKTKLSLSLAISFLTASCAAIQPPDPGGPRTGPPYPVVFTEQAQRTDASLLAFNRLAETTAGQPGVQLQPITAVIKSLPPASSAPFYLPKIGVEAEMNEEETRESLRRFINDWRVLIGANPAHLSLVERIDRPDGIKIAKYEQRPFRYPIRGGFGQLEIQFLSNRAIRNLSSTCLPDADRLQAALAPLTPRMTAEDAVKAVRGVDLPYIDPSGRQTTFRAATSDEVSAVELVTYVLPSAGRTDALELHIAWEMAVGANPRRLIYLDAVDGKLISSATTL